MNVLEGKLFKQAGYPTFFMWKKVPPDTVNAVDCLLGYQSYFLPPGELARFVFKAKTPGICPVSFTAIRLWDIDRVELSPLAGSACGYRRLRLDRGRCRDPSRRRAPESSQSVQSIDRPHALAALRGWPVRGVRGLARYLFRLGRKGASPLCGHHGIRCERARLGRQGRPGRHRRRRRLYRRRADRAQESSSARWSSIR